MITDLYDEWDECPDKGDCELVSSYLELVDAMVKDILHLKAETIRARYELSQKLDPDHQWTAGPDLLSGLSMPHYDSLAYQHYVSTYYDGGDPMSFKDFIDSMSSIIEGIDDGNY